MDNQFSELLSVLKAEDIQETNEHVYFKVGQRQKRVYKEFPEVIQIETSSYCNLVCMGCPQKDLTRARGFMAPELFRKIVDEISNYETRVWLHYMGEPLMNPQIFELIEYASKKLTYFGMASNGMLLTTDKIEKILDSGLYRFEISIDSLDPELLGQLRPGGNPKEIIENAHKYFEIKYKRGQKYPITSINFRELKENLHETRKFAEYWKKILKEPDFVLSFPYERWGGHESPEHARYTVPQDRKPCLKLWNKAIILSDGKLVPCDAMFNGQVVLGDVNNHSIYEIWNGPEYFKMRQKHIDGRAEELYICNKCDSWYREVGPHDFKNLTSSLC
ncbi:MAG: radical SAM protein [Calditrichaeota bacterium]|nr:MAG: radical SAM protein [Calditrichota bacterium]